MPFNVDMKPYNVKVPKRGTFLCQGCGKVLKAGSSVTGIKDGLARFYYHKRCYPKSHEAEAWKRSKEIYGRR